MRIHNITSHRVTEIPEFYHNKIQNIYGNNFEEYVGDVEEGYDGLLYATGYAPSPIIEELMVRVRSERDKRIAACDWVIMRHRDEVDEGDGTTLDADEYAAWLAYRKTLRNMPSLDGFPWDGGGELTPWPVEPVS